MKKNIEDYITLCSVAFLSGFFLAAINHFQIISIERNTIPIIIIMSFVIFYSIKRSWYVKAKDRMK